MKLLAQNFQPFINLVSSFNAFLLDIHNGHIVLPTAMAIMAILASLAIYGPHGYGGWQYQHYGYQVKEHQKTISPVLVSVQYDTPEHSY